MQLYTKINSGSNKTASNDDIHKKVAVQYEQLSKGIVSLIIASNTDLTPLSPENWKLFAYPPGNVFEKYQPTLKVGRGMETINVDSL